MAQAPERRPQGLPLRHRFRPVHRFVGPHPGIDRVVHRVVNGRTHQEMFLTRRTHSRLTPHAPSPSGCGRVRPECSRGAAADPVRPVNGRQRGAGPRGPSARTWAPTTRPPAGVHRPTGHAGSARRRPSGQGSPSARTARSSRPSSPLLQGADPGSLSAYPQIPAAISAPSASGTSAGLSRSGSGRPPAVLPPVARRPR